MALLTYPAVAHEQLVVCMHCQHGHDIAWHRPPLVKRRDDAAPVAAPQHNMARHKMAQQINRVSVLRMRASTGGHYNHTHALATLPLSLVTKRARSAGSKHGKHARKQHDETEGVALCLLWTHHIQFK